VREGARNIMVGVCTLGGVLACAALLFLFGELEPLFAQRWHLEVLFNDAGGLRKGSLVTLNGVPVGSIERISIDWEDPQFPVRVTAAIDEGMRIPDPSKPSVQSSLLGSGARLELTAEKPGGRDPSVYPTDKRIVLRGTVKSLEARLIEQLQEQIDPLVASFGEIGKLAKNLNTLVEPSADGATPNPESIRVAVARMNELLASADTAFKSAQKLLGDEQFQIDIRDTAHNASEFLRDATLTANRIGELAASAQADVAAVRASLVPAVDRAATAMQEVEQLMVAARTGKGTVGRLMQDPQLYENLTDTARRAEEAIAKLNLLLDKIRAEGLGVQLGSP